MNKEDYGEKYSDHLMEQYKLYVEMADRVSQRRDQSNRLYVTLLAALVAILVVVARTELTSSGAGSSLLQIAFLASSAFGVALSLIWFINVWAYRRLNKAKFDVILDMESRLPSDGYAQEWRILNTGNRFGRWLNLTRIEQSVSVVAFLIFVSLGTYSVFWLTR